MKLLEPERIYSTAQLLEALQSGIVGLKEQLQVLSILDGSASSWPGLSSALADLESLVKLTVKHSSKLHSSKQHLEAETQRLQTQLASTITSLKSATSARDQLQSSLDGQQLESRQLQRKLDASELAAEKSKRQLWDLEKTRADLAEQVDQLKADAEFMEGEMAGLKEQLAAQSDQLSALREEVAVKTAELTHTSAALQEQKQSQAHLRNQLDRQLQQNKLALDAAYQQLQTTQDSAAAQLKHVQEGCNGQMRQLQAELAGGTDARQQAQAMVAKLQQEVATLAAELSKSRTEVAWLKEWQDVVKRVSDDRVAETQQQVQAEKALAAKQAVAAASQLQALREQLQQKEAESTTFQRQIALMQAQLREAQRAGQAAAEAQAAASTAIKNQAAELAALRQELRNSEMLVAHHKGDHAAALAATKQAAAAEQAEVKGQLVAAVREAAVGRAHIEGWQRDNQALQDKISQLEAAVVAAKADTQAAQHAAKQEQLVLAAKAAAQVSVMHELQVQLEDSKAEAKRVRMEAASLTKQYGQSLQRLRREADAGAEEVRRLRQAQYNTASAANTSTSDGTQQLQQLQVERRASNGTLANDLSATAAAGSSEAEVPAHIQRELAQLRQYMHTVSGNLQAADAAMQIMAAAQRSKQSSPLIAASTGAAAISPHRQQPAAALCLPEPLAVLQQRRPSQLAPTTQPPTAAATSQPYDGANSSPTQHAHKPQDMSTPPTVQASKGSAAAGLQGAVAASLKAPADSAAADATGRKLAKPAAQSKPAEPSALGAAAAVASAVAEGGAKPSIRTPSKAVANKKLVATASAGAKQSATPPPG